MTTKHLLTTSMSLLAGLMLLPGVGNAATATPSSLQAKITITANCAISAAGTNNALDFGSHVSTESTAATANNGSFTVNCTNLTPFNIGLAGSSGATNGTGTMSDGASPTPHTIGYQLYQDASFSTPWGNTTGTGGNTEASVGTGAAVTYTVYGKTTTTLNVPAGSYTDTVAINVTY
ncbi:hypothetical protein CDEF62S_05530 [Castellaniella defragrans]